MIDLIAPHGLATDQVTRMSQQEVADKSLFADYLSWNLTGRQLCDVEMLLGGAFSPLKGFMTASEYEAVLENGRLPDGTVWPLPITLDVISEFAQQVELGAQIVLRDMEGVPIALMQVSDKWRVEKPYEAHKLFGTTSLDHPGVHYLHHNVGSYYLAGELQFLSLPVHTSFNALRHTAYDLRQHFKQLGWGNIVAFQTNQPMHRAECELAVNTAKRLEANLLIQATVGLIDPSDADHYARIRCYEKLLGHCPQQTSALNVVPYVARLDGPRETLLQALIHKNYGCNYFILSEANLLNDSSLIATQAFIEPFQSDIGIEVRVTDSLVYAENQERFIPTSQVVQTDEAIEFQTADLVQCLDEGRSPPSWFSYSDIVDELRKAHHPKSQQGFTLFFTGLSGSGKSTLANALLVKLLEIGA